LLQLVVLADTILAHQTLGGLLCFFELLLNSHFLSDSCLHDLLRNSGIDGHDSIFFSLKLFLGDGFLLEAVFLFIFSEPFREVVVVFKAVSIIAIINDLVPSSISQHFLGNCQSLGQLINIVVFHLFSLYNFNLSSDILPVYNVFFELFFLLFSIFLQLLSSLLHVSLSFWDDICIIVRNLSFHLFIGINFKVFVV